MASERKAQIDEGVALAKKIDALRQTLGNLERQHANFLAGMETELHGRTDKLFQTIGALQKEVAELEERRALALIPLDAQMEEIRAKTADLGSFQDILKEKEAKVLQKEIIQDKRDQVSKEKLWLANSRDRASVDEYNRGFELTGQIEQAHKAIIASKEGHEKQMAIDNSLIANRLTAIESYEFTLKQRSDELDLREEELAAKNRQVENQRGILERAIKNHGK